MILNKERIKQQGIVPNGVIGRYRDVGYDLSVGTIFVPLTDEESNRDALVGESVYDLPPQGIALVMSRESVRVPANACGFALPKTSLCEDGILVLNTGIVDPGYEGKLSGTILNFGKSACRISEGDAFLRLVFQEVAAVEPNIPPARSDKDRAEKVLRYPSSFLEVEKTVKQVSKKIVDEQKKVVEEERNSIIKLIGTIGFWLALISVVLALWQVVPLYFPSNYEKAIGDNQHAIGDLNRTSEQTRSIMEQLQLTQHKLDEVTTDSKKLYKRIDSLEQKLK